MKVILINIFDSNMTRNILRTQVLSSLKKNLDVKIVVLVPRVKIESYRKEFENSRVKLEPLPQVKMSSLENFSLFICHHSIHTHAARQLIEGGWSAQEGRLPFKKYVMARFFNFFGQHVWYRKLVRLILPFFFKAEVFNEIISQYKPDLIFSPTIYSENDIRLLKLAKRKKIKTVGMIKSWDNLSSKDFLLIPPDKLIVHNELIKDEAIAVGEYSKENIFVSGIPQYDIYTDPALPLSRKEFFDRFKLDISKKLILYAAVGAKHFLEEGEFIRRLAEIINGDMIKAPSQLLVRFHPAYLSEDANFKNIPNVVFYRPGHLNKDTRDILRGSWEFDLEEIRILASTLIYSDVSINCGSTISLDASYFNTPIINIEYEKIPQPYWKGVHRFYTREHYLPLVRSGGIRFPKSEQELIDTLNSYLLNKNLDSAGRNLIKKEQCYKTDGQAGVRIAQFIIDFLQ